MYDNIDFVGRGLHKQIHWLQGMLWFGAPPDSDVKFTQTPFNNMTHNHFEKNEDETKGLDALMHTRILKAEIAAKDESRTDAIDEKVLDNSIAIADLNNKKDAQTKTVRGRPKFREDENKNPTPACSKRMARNIKSVVKDISELEKESLNIKLQSIKHSYTPPNESASDRHKKELQPIAVVEGEQVEVLHQSIDKDYMIALIMKGSLAGYVPLYCITGDPNHQPPIHRNSYLVTPSKVQKNNNRDVTSISCSECSVWICTNTYRSFLANNNNNIFLICFHYDE